MSVYCVRDINDEKGINNNSNYILYFLRAYYNPGRLDLLYFSLNNLKMSYCIISFHG